jgi:hypothetical protein
VLKRLSPAIAILAMVGGVVAGFFASRVESPDTRRRTPETVVIPRPTWRSAPMVDLDEQHAIEQERVAVAAYLAEVARVHAYLAWRAEIEARWTVVGRCEQPLPGGGIQWTLVSSTYSGGLGISNAAWRQWGGLAYASNAGLADPWSQMQVAETIRLAVGRGAWGCPVP